MDPDAVQLRKSVKRFPLGRLFYSEERKYVWCSNPKVASTTIKQVIAQTEYPHLRGDDRLRVHGKGLLNELALRSLKPDFARIYEIMLSEEFFRFVFVRNPYLRLISAFENKINRVTSESGASDRRLKSEVLAKMGESPSALDSSIGFVDFVGFVTEEAPEDANGHWRPQWLVTGADVVNYNFIGRIESFAKDFEFVARRVGLASIAEGVRRKKTTYVVSYEPELRKCREMIAKYYSDDFARFGYDPKIVPAC